MTSGSGASSSEPDLLASLPAEYFMPLDSFDAVQHMLECLPDDVDEAFIEKQEMQTQLVLEAVNVKLSARVMRSYSAFVHGMSQVQQLKSDLTLTAIQCRSARKHLSRIRTETVEPGLTILAKVRRKRALGELLKLTHGVRSLHHDSLEVHARLRSVTNVAESPPPPPGTDVDSAHAPSAAASVSLPFDMLRCAELQRSCERRAAQLSRLKPVKRMEARISSAAEALQDAMHLELRRVSSDFDEGAYASAINCALILDRVDELVNRVHMNFAEAIKVSTKEVLHTHVLLSLRTVTDAQEASLDRGKYKDVCAMLREEYFDSCLAQNFKALLQILHAHDRMLRFLCQATADADKAAAAAKAALDAIKAKAAEADACAKANDRSAGAAAPKSANDALRACSSFSDDQSPPAPPMSASTDRSDEAEATSALKSAEWKTSRLRLLRSMLCESRPTIWDLMQRRVAVFLGSAPLGCGIDEALDVQHATRAFMKLGEAFSGSESEGLRAALSAKGRRFYAQFHRERLDELRMRLESETWEALPLGEDWRMSEIRELSSGQTQRGAPPLRCLSLFNLSTPLDRHPSSEGMNGANGVIKGNAAQCGSGGLGDEEGTLFDGAYAIAAAFFDAMDEGRVPTPQRGPSEEGASIGASPPPPPPPPTTNGRGTTLCSTALNAARFIGRYLRVARDIGGHGDGGGTMSNPLAAEAVRGATGIAQLYIWAVFSTFWTGPPPGYPGFEEHDTSMPTALRNLLLSLASATHTHGVDILESSDESADRQADLVAAAEAIKIDVLQAPLRPKPMFALPQTIVAMESLRLLAGVLKEHLLPAAERLGARGKACAARLNEIVQQTEPLGAQIYRGVARGMLDLAPIVKAISGRVWAQKDIGTQHSGYVEQLVSHMQQLASSLSELYVPPHAYRLLMDEAVSAVCEHMVEGYSQIKKVTDEGRAQMSLDTKTLHAALRKLLPDMAPSVGYVEDYIRAFYLPPEDLIAWARSHPQYLMRHRMAMMTLNGVYAGLKKKEQQEVLEALTQLVE